MPQLHACSLDNTPTVPTRSAACWCKQHVLGAAAVVPILAMPGTRECTGAPHHQNYLGLLRPDVPRLSHMLERAALFMPWSNVAATLLPTLAATAANSTRLTPYRQLPKCPTCAVLRGDPQGAASGEFFQVVERHLSTSLLCNTAGRSLDRLHRHIPPLETKNLSGSQPPSPKMQQ
jgi:hypothetical protein